VAKERKARGETNLNEQDEIDDHFVVSSRMERSPTQLLSINQATQREKKQGTEGGAGKFPLSINTSTIICVVNL
jgi:hypothetical protein